MHNSQQLQGNQCHPKNIRWSTSAHVSDCLPSSQWHRNNGQLHVHAAEQPAYTASQHAWAQPTVNTLPPECNHVIDTNACINTSRISIWYVWTRTVQASLQNRTAHEKRCVYHHKQRLVFWHAFRRLHMLICGWCNDLHDLMTPCASGVMCMTDRSHRTCLYSVTSILGCMMVCQTEIQCRTTALFVSRGYGLRHRSIVRYSHVTEWYYVKFQQCLCTDLHWCTDVCEAYDTGHQQYKHTWQVSG